MTTEQTDASTDNAVRNEADADSPPVELEPGMCVVDREQAPAERDPAVVMSRPPVPADQWELDHIDGTLADDNPAYPDDARTVVVIYRERFEDTEGYPAIPVPDDVRDKLANGEPVSIAATRDLCKFYTFPEPRLEPTGERWPRAESSDPDGDSFEREADTESEHENIHTENRETDFNSDTDAETAVGDESDEHDDLARLASVVREAGFSGVQQRDSGIEAKKLGETYRIDRDGEVIEGGAFSDKLASFIEERYES